MPVGPGRYRVKTTASGKRVRLHFTPRGTVNEAKNIDTGATTTPDDFAADRQRRRKTATSLRSSLTAMRAKGAFGQ